MVPVPHNHGPRNGSNPATSARPNSVARSAAPQIRPASMAAPPNRTRTAATSSSTGSVTGGVLRNASSTSSLRGKTVSTQSRTQTAKSNPAPSKQQQQQQPIQPKSLLASIPVPTFPTLDPASIHVTQAQVAKRLLQLAYSYVGGNNETFLGSKSIAQDEVINDSISACFYARLALNCDPASIPARRLLASLLLQGVQVFPFGPTVNQSVSLSSPSIHRANAHAAIELLESGPEDIFMDLGCAQIFSTACLSLGRLKEAGEALSWTIREGEKGVNSSANSSFSRIESVPSPFTALESVRKASVFSELGKMSARTNRFDEAKVQLRKARDLDSWSWSAWSGLCDIGAKMEEIDNSHSFFPIQKHQPQSVYPFHLEQALLSKGHEKDFVTQVISHMTQQGANYFSQKNVASESGKEERMASIVQKGAALSARSQAPAQNASLNAGEEMARTSSNKRTVAQAITPSSTTSSLARPGSRTDTTTTSKRMRTMPSTQPSSQSQKAVSNITGGRVGMTIGPAAAKGKLAPATATTAGSVRMTGTLSASRTNEQAKAVSVVDDDNLKSSPRRSARVAVPLDEQERSTPAIMIKRTIGSRPIASDAQARVKTTKSDDMSNTADKGFTDLVEATALESSRRAMEHEAIDAQISELARTFARAYHAVRNARGRLALALLRPRGTLSKQDADDLLREAVLSVPESERDQLRNQSIQVYGGLSSVHRNCADVQCLLGRIHHELGRYHLAEKHFMHARHLSPSLIANMDIFSLSLFHLQREVRLSQLVKELQILDPASSTTLIAAGNAFALQHEHSAALRSFQKACSIAPHHAYAFTLAGYEANELGDKEKSLQYFREAIKIEKRHWNAYAGIGQIHLQEEKLNSASYYYGQALDLQRSNAILWDIFGRIKMAQGCLAEAERAFECALRLDPRSAMSHIKLAETLLRRRSTVEDDSGQYHDRAHENLLKAVKLAPDEAHVHLMLAKSYMDKGSGTFATLLRNKDRGVAAEEKDGPEEVSLSELAQIPFNSGPIHLIMQQQQQIRATGQATLPQKYRAEIAQHLSTAIDLNPRLSRYVKAMGEGARAALRGAAARLTGDHSTMISASFLNDQTGMSTEGIVDSMLELEDDTGQHVLEDPVSESEEVMVQGDEGQEDGYIQAEDEDHYHPSSQSIDDDNDIIAPQLDQFGRRLRRQRSQLGLGLSMPERTISGATHAPPRDISGGSQTDLEQDVSMSF